MFPWPEGPETQVPKIQVQEILKHVPKIDIKVQDGRLKRPSFWTL